MTDKTVHNETNIAEIDSDEEHESYTTKGVVYGVPAWGYRLVQNGRILEERPRSHPNDIAIIDELISIPKEVFLPVIQPISTTSIKPVERKE
jgi:hypothetical protein